MLDIGVDRIDRIRPRRGGGTYIITYIDDKCHSDTVLCLFGFLFSAFLKICLISFNVIMIMNELCRSFYVVYALEGL